MVAVHLITTLAQKETARQAILKQLRDAGSVTPQMPGSLTIDGDEAQAALAELLAAGTVKEARGGRYYLDEPAAKETKSVSGFVALLALLVALSFTASMIALAATAG